MRLYPHPAWTGYMCKGYSDMQSHVLGIRRLMWYKGRKLLAGLAAKTMVFYCAGHMEMTEGIDETRLPGNKLQGSSEVMEQSLIEEDYLGPSSRVFNLDRTRHWPSATLPSSPGP